MCDNAAIYNKPKSQVHSDSLRLRKLMDTFDESNGTGVKRDAEAHPTPGRTSTRGSKGSPAALQQAMLKIVDDMLNLEHESGGLVAQAFKNLPSKKFYAEYFRVIARPISLNQIRNRASNSIYEQWSDFEEDILLIRKNAEEYNAEGSDIVKDARTLETFFNRRLHDEKVKLGDPVSSGIKLRLNVGPEQAPASVAPKIKLNLGGKHPPTSQTPSNTNGISHSQPSPAPTAPAAPPNIAATQPQTAQQPKSQTAPQHSPTHPAQQGNNNPHRPIVPPSGIVSATPPPRTRLDSIKTNGSHSPPPGSIVVRPRSETPLSQSAMPPPTQRLSSTPRPASYSPMPPAQAVQAPGPISAPQVFQPAYVHHLEPTFRSEGKDKSDALISNLCITSTSTLNQEVKFSRDLEPDDRKVTAQYFVHLSSEFDTVVLTPTLAPSLTGREMYIVRVVHWSNNIQMSKQISPSGQQKKNEPMYNVRLNPGVVNTIEVTAVTQKNTQNGYAAGVERWEMERFRVFISSLQQ
ncbi:hypothetical protein BDD12DRAFT_820159 [Trichophaea hybrida]|nr:hypothetical protein BDD12DRAFT_820159 [Trichophaea hybrida]